MNVRAKFKVTRYETQTASVSAKNADGSYKKDERGNNVYEKVEQRTVTLHPVYDDRPGSENKKFWDATPSGEIRLGTVNPAVWKLFELDKEYYVDFSLAPVE